MKPALFCSILIAFFSFSCKPKPLDNLKEVAKQVEENKVFRVSRERLAKETLRVSDSVLTLIFKEQQHLVSSDSACDLVSTKAYRRFQQKYHGRVSLLSEEIPLKKLQAEMDELRRYRYELSLPTGKFPATFQTLNDSLLYVRPLKQEELVCKGEKSARNGYWVFRYPKQKFIEVLTVKVKPKPAKGPNW